MRLIFQLIRRLKKRIQNELRQALVLARIECKKASIHPSVQIHLDIVGKIEFSGSCSIGANTVIFIGRGPGDNDSNPKLVVGDGTFIGESCNLRAGSGDIIIGEKCLIAAHVVMAATNHGVTAGHFIMDQPWSLERKDIFIGKDVWIGSHAVILPGSRIGDGAVIAAGAVVRGQIAPDAIVAGVPAKVVGSRR
jgi:acetyltransferase-like isoleucine patch superfamily enzyme